MSKHRWSMPRLIMNTIFWLLFLAIQINNLPNTYDYNPIWYYLLLTINFVIAISLTYLNVLVLIPRLLKGRKYIKYILMLCGLIIGSGIVTVLINKAFISAFPKVQIYQVTFIEDSLSGNWGYKYIFNESAKFFAAYLNIQFLFIAGWFFWNYTTESQKRTIAEKKQTETELSFLKSQINPHFLFNSLNNLYALAVKNSNKTPDAILKLSKLLRYLLYESNERLIHFDKEKEALEAFIDMELLRVSDRSIFKFNIFADKDYSIPPLLWLPILENVFKYGINIISNQYFVEFEFVIVNNTIFINSKNLFNKKRKIDQSRSGIGFENLKKRLDILYDSNYRFDHYEKDDYYYVELEIDLL